jgi:hypothetical protein
MAEKVKDMKMKKASKAMNKKGEKGQWWPCNLTDFEPKSLQEEGVIAPGSYRFTKNSSTPILEVNERVFTKAWVERGISLPPRDFFLEVLNTYGLQPHKHLPQRLPHPLELHHPMRRSSRSQSKCPAPSFLLPREEGDGG